MNKYIFFDKHEQVHLDKKKKKQVQYYESQHSQLRL